MQSSGVDALSQLAGPDCFTTPDGQYRIDGSEMGCAGSARLRAS